MVLVKPLLSRCAIGLMVHQAVVWAVPIDTRGEHDARYLYMMPDDDNDPPTPDIPEGIPHRGHSLVQGNRVESDGTHSLPPGRPIWSDGDDNSPTPNIPEGVPHHPHPLSPSDVLLGSGPMRTIPAPSSPPSAWSESNSMTRIAITTTLVASRISPFTIRSDENSLGKTKSLLPSGILVSDPGPIVLTTATPGSHPTPMANVKESGHVLPPDISNKDPGPVVHTASVWRPLATTEIKRRENVLPLATRLAGRVPIMPSTTQEPRPILPFPPGFDWKCHHAEGSFAIPQYNCSRSSRAPKATGIRPCSNGVCYGNRLIVAAFPPSTPIPPTGTDRHSVPLIQDSSPPPTTPLPPLKTAKSKRYQPHPLDHHFNETDDVAQLAPFDGARNTLQDSQ